MASKQKPQATRILKYLATGKELTKLTAKKRFGVQRLPARIYDLREEGWKIYTGTKVVKGKKLLAYQMAEKDRQVASRFSR